MYLVAIDKQDIKNERDWVGNHTGRYYWPLFLPKLI